MKIFEFENYKKFVNFALSQRPKRGRGQYRRLAEALRLSSVAVSQIFKGERDLSLEQAFAAARFLLLSKEETEFFLLLVQKARAGSKDLENYFSEKIREAQALQQKLASHVEKEAFPEEAKSIFYSNWFYSAVRIATSIPELKSVDALAAHFQLPREKVEAIVTFLLRHQLCVQGEEGLAMGPQSTMLPADSPFINNHRRNWRLKGLELMGSSTEELFYSGVVSLSQQDVKKLRQRYVDLIAETVKLVKDSPGEELYCMNLDWFEIK